MNKMFALCVFSGAVGGAMAELFGGWQTDLTTLVIIMIADYITGVIAALMHRSDKSKNGSLSSRAGFIGLVKKAVILLMVLVAYRLDVSCGTSFIKSAVVVGFIVNESISVAENAALIGIPLPDALRRGIDILSKKENNDDK